MPVPLCCCDPQIVRGLTIFQRLPTLDWERKGRGKADRAKKLDAIILSFAIFVFFG